MLAINENVVHVLEKTFIPTEPEKTEPEKTEPENMEPKNMELEKTDEIEDDIGGDGEMADEEHDLYTLLGLGFIIEEEEDDGHME